MFKYSILSATMKPFAHQARVLEQSKDLPFFAVFWEQGTGKTKLALDTCIHLGRAKKIDGLFVLAPNGVHRNWVEDEIPKHMPESPNIVAEFYQSSKAGTKAHQSRMQRLLHARFPMLAMSYSAFMTKRGRALAMKLLKRRMLFVLDESHAIKTPSAKRTFAIVAAGKRAPYRRILTGTPVANKPFDVYSPMRFLHTDFWRQHGFATSSEFKEYFGIWQQGMNNGRAFKHIVAFRNLEDLKAIIEPHSSRVTKDEVLDLPPKLYSKRYFDLTPSQWKVYNSIRDEILTTLDSGATITAQLALTRLLRLQQVTSNYITTDEGKLLSIDTKLNSRLKCLADLLEEIDNQTIIWARFRRDIDHIMNLLKSKAVRYDGAVPEADRAIAKSTFQSGNVQFFVGNPAAAGLGLTLTAARTVVYYTNSFNLVDRLQSEDRAHRIGQEHPVEIIDIMAPSTVDMHIVAALRTKVNIASTITGDMLREWI